MAGSNVSTSKVGLNSGVAQTREPDADCFRAGDVWENSRGARHKVLRIERRIAYMINEGTGRTYHRAWDDLGWKSGRLWVRVSCGVTTAATPPAVPGTEQETVS